MMPTPTQIEKARIEYRQIGRKKLVDNDRHDGRDSNADDACDDAYDDGLNQKLDQDRSPLGPDGFADTDLYAP